MTWTDNLIFNKTFLNDGIKDPSETNPLIPEKQIRDLIITDALMPINAYSRPGKPCVPTHIVIHWTGNPGSSARGNRDYFANYCRTHQIYAGAHYVVGLKGEILKCIPENEIAYHAGGRAYTDYAQKTFYNIGLKRVYPHNKCIGIETCHPDLTGKFNDVTLESLIHLTADIAKRNGIKVENIIRHHDVTGKDCPKYFVEHENEWILFKKEIETLMI